MKERGSLSSSEPGKVNRRTLLKAVAAGYLANRIGLFVPEHTIASPLTNTETLPSSLTLQGADFRREDGTQLEIRLLDNPDQGVRHLREGIAALKQPSVLTQETRSQLAQSESGRETLRLHSLAADTNRNAFMQAETGDGSFTLNGHAVDSRFGTYWSSNGGLRQQGLPISDGFNENNPTNGQTYRVQYFERARFEYHPEVSDPNYQVLLGLTGREQYYAKYPNGAPNQIPNTAPGAAQFPETGKYVGDRFLAYWAANGGLRQQGLPISDEFDEVNPTDGKTYRVQYFERARFEYHPEVSDPSYQVLLGLTGREQFLAKYPNGVPTGEVPPTGKEKIYRGNGWLFYNSDGALVSLEPTNPDALNQLPSKLPPGRATALYMARDMKDATALAIQLGLDPKNFDDVVVKDQFVGKAWMVPFGTPGAKPTPRIQFYDQQRIQPILASDPGAVHLDMISGALSNAVLTLDEFGQLAKNGTFDLMLNNTKITY